MQQGSARTDVDVDVVGRTVEALPFPSEMFGQNCHHSLDGSQDGTMDHHRSRVLSLVLVAHVLKVTIAINEWADGQSSQIWTTEGWGGMIDGDRIPLDVPPARIVRED